MASDIVVRCMGQKLETDDPSRVLRLRDFTFAARAIAGSARQTLVDAHRSIVGRSDDVSHTSGEASLSETSTRAQVTGTACSRFSARGAWTAPP